MRINDWSSDVCSSDLNTHFLAKKELFKPVLVLSDHSGLLPAFPGGPNQVGIGFKRIYIIKHDFDHSKNRNRENQPGNAPDDLTKYSDHDNENRMNIHLMTQHQRFKNICINQLGNTKYDHNTQNNTNVASLERKSVA